MADHYFITVDEKQIKKEKEKARDLRQTQWWKRRRSTGRCHYCGRTYRPADLTMDHLVPIVRGGKSVHANVVPACKECNAKKKYLLPVEWEEYLEGLQRGQEDPSDQE